MKSFKSEVCRTDRNFGANAMRFATSAEALAYAEKLADASCAIADYRVGSSVDGVTHTFAAGKLRAVAAVPEVA